MTDETYYNALDNDIPGRRLDEKNKAQYELYARAIEGVRPCAIVELAKQIQGASICASNNLKDGQHKSAERHMRQQIYMLRQLIDKATASRDAIGKLWEQVSSGLDLTARDLDEQIDDLRREKYEVKQ